MKKTTTTYSPYVFISYAESDYRDRALASGIALYLQHHRIRVWMAPKSLLAGSDWKSEIEKAILSETTHFLVIISAASAASQYVNVEINLAKSRYLKDEDYLILPLEVGSISHFKGSLFLDQFQRVAFHHNRKEQLDALAVTFGIGPSSRTAQPYHDQFVGRSHIINSIDSFVSEHDRGVITIVGSPGDGKSALLSHVSSIRPSLFHANSISNGVRTTRQCLSSLMRQACANDGFERSAFSLSNSEENFPEHWATLLENLVSQEQNEPRMLIIDALDEADQTRLPLGQNILSIPANLPQNAYLLVSRRRAAVPLRSDVPVQTIDLGDYPQENRSDAILYIEMLEQLIESVRDWLGSYSKGREAAIETIVSKSQYNFMYLRCLLSDVAKNGPRSDLDQLPSGLTAYYEDHWHRMGMSASQPSRLKLSILAALARFSAPLSRRMLADVLDADPVDVQLVLNEWEPFLTQNLSSGGTILHSIYHESFRNFLLENPLVQASSEVLADLDAKLAFTVFADFDNN